ncbi:MAG: hypothetical protein J6W70_06190, partial [Lentisphaeria bacterium]|nr:hypothetical protein [Lentisphaeria bacterium]
ASVEVELPDGLTPEQLNAKIRETFALVRDSVEVELHSEPVNTQTSNVPPLPIPLAQPQQNKPAYSKNSKTADAPASPKQIKYLLDLARQFGVSPDQLKVRFNVPALESLTKTQCSRAIDELSGKAA